MTGRRSAPSPPNHPLPLEKSSTQKPDDGNTAKRKKLKE
jgi:hypothetical protein